MRILSSRFIIIFILCHQAKDLGGSDALQDMHHTNVKTAHQLQSSTIHNPGHHQLYTAL